MINDDTMDNASKTHWDIIGCKLIDTSTYTESLPQITKGRETSLQTFVTWTIFY